jgi:hypothetical protein
MKVEHEAYLGNGKEISPFRMSTIGQWAKAAADVTTVNADLYIIGGHLIERVPANGENQKEHTYANYVTDVLEAVPSIGPFHNGISTTKRPRSFPPPEKPEPSERKKGNQVPVYRYKFERIQTATLGKDAEVARQIRALLAGGMNSTVPDLGGLPGIVAALFLAEVHRAPVMLPVGLMLLDLIERQVKYGEDGTKTYTIEKMMSDAGAIKMLKDDPENEQAKKDMRLWGGKHPMVHDGTINQAASMFTGLNAVTKKTVSIMCAWLNAYLQRNYAHLWTVGTTSEARDYNFGETSLKKRLKNFDISIKKSGRSPAYDFYLTAVEPALQKRVKTLDCLL